MEKVDNQDDPSAKRLRVETGEEQKPAVPSNSIVKLNVGGTNFDTSRVTLLSHGSPYFGRLLEAGHDGIEISGALSDEQGRLFIDRCPILFRQILSYLRGSLDANKLTAKEKGVLRNEAIYYQLDDLVDQLTPPTRGYDENFLSEGDRDIRHQARCIRESLHRPEDGAVEKADAALVDVYRNGGCEYTGLYEAAATSPKATFLFENQVVKARRGMRNASVPDSITQFQEKLVEYGGPLLAGLDMKNIVIAGGAVLRTLQDCGPETGNADVDLFIIADDDATARSTYDRVVSHLTRRNGTDEINHDELLVVRSPFACTLVVGYPQRPLQVILRRHSCISDVIFNFDVDACQLAYDGKSVWATPSALRALKTGINLADPERSGPEYELRLAKYASRGFLVGVPGLYLEKVKGRYRRGGVFTLQEGYLKEVHLDFEKGKEGPSCKVEAKSIVGLSKLIVYSNLHSGFYLLTSPTRFERPDSFLPGTCDASVSNMCFLINVDKVPLGKWEYPTPPHNPPEGMRQSLLGNSPESSSGGGGPLFPFQPNMTPSVYMEELTTSLAQKARFICYDFIRDCRRTVECPNVEDAARQYPHMPFEAFAGIPGKLRRHLEFPSSSELGTDPWQRGSESEWTSDVYDTEE